MPLVPPSLFGRSTRIAQGSVMGCVDIVETVLSNTTDLLLLDPLVELLLRST